VDGHVDKAGCSDDQTVEGSELEVTNSGERERGRERIEERRDGRRRLVGDVVEAVALKSAEEAPLGPAEAGMGGWLAAAETHHGGVV